MGRGVGKETGGMVQEGSGGRDGITVVEVEPSSWSDAGVEEDPVVVGVIGGSVGQFGGQVGGVILGFLVVVVEASSF